jgi:hypothetical protein
VDRVGTLGRRRAMNGQALLTARNAGVVPAEAGGCVEVECAVVNSVSSQVDDWARGCSCSAAGAAAGAREAEERREWYGANETIPGVSFRVPSRRGCPVSTRLAAKGQKRRDNITVRSGGDVLMKQRKR